VQTQREYLQPAGSYERIFSKYIKIKYEVTGIQSKTYFQILVFDKDMPQLFQVAF
jgi:hypothetical protein